LIDERDVFERFHEALDAQPGPGAFDRLQAALVERPVMPPRLAWTVRPVPRVGLRVAAACLIAVLLTLAVASAFLAVHLRASRTTPAKASPTNLTGQLNNDEWPRMMTLTSGWSGTPMAFFHTTDGGATWRSAMPRQLDAVNDQVRASYFLDADHAWIAVDISGVFVSGHVSLTVFATSDGGRTWTAGAPVPSGYEPYSGRGLTGSMLDFLDARVGWLLTASDPGPHTVKLYGTTDGGRTWRLILEAADSDGSTLATLGQGCFENELKFVSVDLGWMNYDCIASRLAGLGSGSPVAGPELAVTKDGGRSWQQVLLPPTSTGYDVCNAAPIFYNSSVEILVGSCFKSSQITSPVPLSGQFPNQFLTAADGRAAIYVSSDAGLSWSLRAVPTDLSIAGFIDANTAWSLRWPGDILRTSDGGITWKLIGAIPVGSSNGSLDLEVFDSNLAIAITSDLSGSLTTWKTTDGGRTWVRVSGPSPTS
jgi:photosystem II stability/assembly factor-like uncharacterized protein